MICKFLEIRDRATFIPALAIKIEAGDSWLARRVGFPGGIIFMRLSNQEAHSDPYDWRGDTRTMPNAHVFVDKHFDELVDGQLIDVEVILGEKTVPADSEQFL